MSTLSRRAHVKETGIVLAVFLVIAFILWAFTACNTAVTPKREQRCFEKPVTSQSTL